MAEYIERKKLYNNLVLLAKYEIGERQQGILGCAETVRIFPAADVAPVQKWINVKDRLPIEEEYTARAEDGTEYYVRLLIAYKTDIVEYKIGYYDGYKWMTEMPIRLIKDVVAWMPFPNMPQPPKEE